MPMTPLEQQLPPTPPAIPEEPVNEFDEPTLPVYAPVRSNDYRDAVRYDEVYPQNEYPVAEDYAAPPVYDQRPSWQSPVASRPWQDMGDAPAYPVQDAPAYPYPVQTAPARGYDDRRDRDDYDDRCRGCGEPEPEPDPELEVPPTIFRNDPQVLASSTCVISPAYPGTPLRLGSTGANVALIQRYLNALRVTMNPMPPLLNVDGRYGPLTRSVVMRFQSATGLAVDGVVGRLTWNAIVLRYNCLFGQPEQPQPPVTPSLPMRPGSRGPGVQLLQGLLNMMSTIYSSILPLTEDGIYGTQTTAAVRTFQHMFCLVNDGVVGPITWNMIMTVAQSQLTHPIGCIFVGQLIRMGSTGEVVRIIQSVLNRTRAIFGHNWLHLNIDGIFGSQTHNAVIQFQIAYSLLQHDGIVGPLTSNVMIRIFNDSLPFGVGD